MSDHTHSQYVAGCFRCDLSRDEVASGYVTEAMIEKCATEARAWGVRSSHGGWSDEETQRNCARDILEAAAPLIAAQAWDEGHAAGCTDPYATYGECGCGPNPYRERGES